MTDVEKWIKQSNKKKAKLISYENGVYDIVFYFKDKVRIGKVEDGMYCRFGIRTRGAMVTDDILTLWQGVGGCSKEDVKIMQDYLNGACSLPDFDFSVIKDLKH